MCNVVLLVEIISNNLMSLYAQVTQSAKQ